MTDMNDESGIARVLAAAGARMQPPAAMAEAVRVAAHAEWRAMLAARARRRRMVFALAASAVIAIFGFWLSRTWLTPRGEDVTTDRSHYAALTFPGNISVRLDRDTHIVRLNPQHIVLRQGAVYVDAGLAPHESARHLQIDTPSGSVSHVGTQYEVRLLPVGTRIRVREGRVELGGPAPVILQARDQLLVSGSGLITRTSIAPDSSEWDWAVQAAPAFEIEGRSLAQFLAWAGRELGCEIVYATPEAKAESMRAVLNGSTAGLTPTEALAAVLPTTRLRSLRREGKILIESQ